MNSGHIKLEVGKLYLVTKTDREPTDYGNLENVVFERSGIVSIPTGQVWQTDSQDINKTCGRVRRNTPFMVLERIPGAILGYKIMQTNPVDQHCEMGYAEIKFKEDYLPDRIDTWDLVWKFQVWEIIGTTTNGSEKNTSDSPEIT